MITKVHKDFMLKIKEEICYLCCALRISAYTLYPIDTNGLLRGRWWLRDRARHKRPSDLSYGNLPPLLDTQPRPWLDPPHASLLCSCHGGVAVPCYPQSPSLDFSEASHYSLSSLLYLQLLVSCSLLADNENCSTLFHTNEMKEGNKFQRESPGRREKEWVRKREKRRKEAP